MLFLSTAFMHHDAWTPSPPSGGLFSPNSSNTPWMNPQTPQRRKVTASVRLQGIKTTMPNNLSLASILWCLISILKLKYVLDDWQVHLIHWILQGYDSIFCAGTGYGKSLIFEGLAVLGRKGKLVIVISPLKVLEHDQVCSPFFFFGALTVFQAEQAIAKGIDTLFINKKIQQKPWAFGNTLVQVRPWSTCHSRWLLPPVSKNYGKIPVFKCKLSLVFKSPVWSGFLAKFWRNHNRTGCLLSRFMGNRQPDRKKLVEKNQLKPVFFNPNLFILCSVVTHKNVVKNLKLCK